MAFMATIESFDIPDLASKIIPSMSFSLVDEEKYASHCNFCLLASELFPRLVRDQAFKALDMFTKKIHEYATNLVRFSQKQGE